jgi:hypothetical protein
VIIAEVTSQGSAQLIFTDDDPISSPDEVFGKGSREL